MAHFQLATIWHVTDAEKSLQREEAELSKKERRFIVEHLNLQHSAGESKKFENQRFLRKPNALRKFLQIGTLRFLQV